MKRLANLLLLAVGAAFFVFTSSSKTYAQDQSPSFSFDNFTGTYYLDRDAKGVATLTAQEDMIVEFPAGGNLYGIRRLLPLTYQNHPLNLKIISLTDASGTPIKYNSFSDGKGNEVIQ